MTDHLDTLPPRVRAILLDVAEKHNVTPAEIVGPGRTAEIVRARRCVIRRLAGFVPAPSYNAIGKWLGICHTSVLYHLGRRQ
jgi:chromosomal replication initiation ATPase DnaA